MVSFDPKSYSKKLLPLISWSHWFTFFNIIAAIILSSYYLFSETAPTTFLGQTYLITTWVSHIGFLTFMSYVLILFPLTLIFPNTKFIRTCGSIIFTVGLLLLVLDGFIYSSLGYHLNASSSAQIIEVLQDIVQEDAMFFIFSGALAIIVLGFEFTISNYAWKHLKQLQKTVFARFFIFGLVLSFFFSHLTHIWADANLDYDILRQDTVLPLSYPATAKTLLTKYGLFDISDYIERKNSPLSFHNLIPDYKLMDELKCSNSSYIEGKSTFLILSEQQLSPKQFNQFIQRSSGNTLLLNNNIDTGVSDDAWFNAFYSLPSIYQSAILKQNVKPYLFQSLENMKLATSLTVISSEDETNEALPFEHLFDEKIQLNNVSTLLFADKLNNKPAGLHVIYFTHNSSSSNSLKANSQYQFELYIDALLLAQKQKTQKDYIWISAMGNLESSTRLSTKDALLISPTFEGKKAAHKEQAHNTSTMDLQPTLMNQWLGCEIDKSQYSNGTNVMSLKRDRVIANTTEQGIIVFNKDKSVFIDQNGNFQSYSSQLSAPITVDSDFPLMIDGMQFIKRFSNKPK
jgi:membrane-anchored protein YejM (alkaline phosphatase superfamily)